MAKSFYDVSKDFAGNAMALAQMKRQQAKEDFANQIAFAQLGTTLQEAPIDRRLKEAQAQEAELKSKRLGIGMEKVLGGGGVPSNLKVKDYDEYGLPKSYFDPQQDLEQKRMEEAQKPLSGDTAGKFSGAEQSLKQIQAVKAMVNAENFNNLKSGFSKIRVGNKLGITNPESVMGNAINATTLGLARRGVKTDDNQKAFENALNLLAENQLRARTGAAAPQPEIDREVQRILASDDSLESFLNKLKNSEQFVSGVADSIRPSSKKVPAWASSNPERYEAAQKAGFSEDQIMDWFRRNAA